jgi:hypothetical protein
MLDDSEVTGGREVNGEVFKPPPSMARSAADWATSFIRGLAKGTIGLAGLPGDASNLVGQGVLAAGRAIGLPEPPESAKNARGTLLPTSETLTKSLPEAAQKALEQKAETAGGKYAQSVGEFIPGVIGGEGSLARKAVQAIAGGAGGEAGAQIAEKIAPDYETAARVLGGITGQGLPGTVRKAIAPSNIEPERQAAADFLKKKGVDITAGDLSGSKVTKHTEHALGTSPGSGGAYDAARRNTDKQFTAAALKEIGEKGDAATPEVMERAAKRIGKDFDNLAAANSVKPDMKYVADLLGAEQKYNDLFLHPLNKPIVEKLVEQQMQNVSRGTLSGKAYQAQASALREIQMGHGDTRVRSFAADLRDALDDAMERSIKKNNPDDLGKWQEARRQYRNLLVLERAAAAGGVDAAAGVVSPGHLRQAVVAEQGRRSYARGKGDFDKLARAGNLLLTKPPTSGTAERAFLHAIPAGIGATIGHGLEGNLGGAAGTMAGLAAPGVAGRAAMSKPMQGYLKNKVAEKLGIDPATLDSLSPPMLDKIVRSAIGTHANERPYKGPNLGPLQGNQ